MKRTEILLLFFLFLSFLHSSQGQLSSVYREERGFLTGSDFLGMDWKLAVALAAFLSLMLVVIAYVLGVAFGLPQLKAWAFLESRQTISNLILVGILLAGIIFIDNLLGYLGQEAGVEKESNELWAQALAKDYINDVLIMMEEQVKKDIFEASYNLGSKVGKSEGESATTLFLPIPGLWTYWREGAEESYYYMDLQRMSILMEYYSVIYPSLKAQRDFVSFISPPAGAFFLILGFVLRAFSFTRRLGGLLASVGVALLFFLPASFVFNKFTLSITLYGDDALPSDSKEDCDVSCVVAPPLGYSPDFETRYTNPTDIRTAIGGKEPFYSAIIVDNDGGEIEYLSPADLNPSSVKEYLLALSSLSQERNGYFDSVENFPSICCDEVNAEETGLGEEELSMFPRCCKAWDEEDPSICLVSACTDVLTKNDGSCDFNSCMDTSGAKAFFYSTAVGWKNRFIGIGKAAEDASKADFDLTQNFSDSVVSCDYAFVFEKKGGDFVLNFFVTPELCPRQCRQIPYPFSSSCNDPITIKACSYLPDACFVNRTKVEVDEVKKAKYDSLCPIECRAIPPLKMNCFDCISRIPDPSCRIINKTGGWKESCKLLLHGETDEEIMPNWDNMNKDVKRACFDSDFSPGFPDSEEERERLAKKSCFFIVPEFNWVPDQEKCGKCVLVPSDFWFYPLIEADCMEKCQGMKKTTTVSTSEFIQATKKGMVGKNDIKNVAALFFPAYILPLFNIVITVVAAKGLSNILGGDFEIPGISKFL